MRSAFAFVCLEREKEKKLHIFMFTTHLPSRGFLASGFIYLRRDEADYCGNKSNLL